MDIRVLFSGSDMLSVSPQEELILDIGRGQMKQTRPRAYQKYGADTVDVRSRYVVTGPGEVAFELGQYDHTAALVIDVTLVFSSYLGGNAEDSITSIALDSAGNVYLAGWTLSTNLSATNRNQSGTGGGLDAFVAKMNPTGSTLLYITYLGGLGEDRAFGVAVDASGGAVVTGWTYSTNFPKLHAAQAALSEGRDASVVKLTRS